jgi:hypothetical protein
VAEIELREAAISLAIGNALSLAFSGLSLMILESCSNSWKYRKQHGFCCLTRTGKKGGKAMRGRRANGANRIEMRWGFRRKLPLREAQ